MKKWLMMAVLFWVILSGTAVYAGESESELQVNWIEGPTVVDLGENLAQLNIDEKYLFANAEDAKKIMEYYGNMISDNEIGLIAPIDPAKDWLVLFEYEAMGYIKDDDASELDAETILADYKEGTDLDNKRREKKGYPQLNLFGWDEKPN